MSESLRGDAGQTKKKKRKEIEKKRETRQCLDHANCVVEVEAGAEIMVSIDPGGGGGLP